jgi:4-hydroxyacetophenone monooxygenase
MSNDPSELRDATDEQIDDAVQYADPLALRGLLYQLTGDEEVAATKVGETERFIGAERAVAITDPADVALLRAKAAQFLKGLRNAGGGPIGPGPADRLPRSLALAAGVKEIPPADLELWTEEVALQPYARGLHWSKEPPAERLRKFKLIVIGTGLGGLNVAVQLKQAGIDFLMLEKNPEVGGTWYENKYPGARVDSPSRSYTHIFGVDFDWSSPWCTRDENQRYFKWIADRFGLREQIVFETEVSKMAWDDASSTWELHTQSPKGPRTYRAQAVVSAVGLLSRPRLPDVPGMDEFKGPSFHTARWPDDLDLRDKRIGVIGTGCSGVQLVPELARISGQVTMFQRTPQWLFEHDGYLKAFPPQARWLVRNFPYHAHFTRFRAHWLLGPYLSGPTREVDFAFEDPFARSSVNKRIRDARVAFIQRKLESRPDLIEKLIPAHPPMSARPIQVDASDSLYDALLRDNVTLVTEGIERVTPTGIRTVDGVEHELDAIAYATGFKANECLWPMEVLGRGGRSVYELWAKDGPRAYLGAMLPDFPNLFLIYGPNMNPYGGLGVVNFQEMVTRFLLQCVEDLIVGGHASVEVTEDAYWRYNGELDERERFKIYKDPRANSYYTSQFGRSVTNCPFPGNEMWHRLRRPNYDDMIVR